MALDVEIQDDGSVEDDHEWLLGFTQPVQHSHLLLRHRFPSKVGGRPAWLHPVDLPTEEELVSPTTLSSLRFLLQVYAPVDGNLSSFHRSVFVFVPSKGSEIYNQGSVRAYRCQLPRQNAFYSFHPSGKDDIMAPALPGLEDEAAARRDPWRVAQAELAVASAARHAPAAADPPLPLPPCEVELFPELELVVEPEEEYLSEAWEEVEEGGLEGGAEASLRSYHERVAAEGELSDDELPESVLDLVEAAVPEEKARFAAFQARVMAAPTQVLRYCFDATAAPLWPGAGPTPGEGEIPPCPRCGAPRQFEFQVLPQLLNYLEQDEDDEDALDWGTIAVYSCSRSCSPTPHDNSAHHRAYAEEFVWVQRM